MNIKRKVGAALSGTWDTLRSRPAAALAGGLAALLLAGGTATAAATIGSEDIKDDSILRKDLSQDHVMFDIDNVFWNELAGRIKPDINQVWTSEIINGTILPEDLSDEAKDSLHGTDGKDGADGKDGVSGYEVDGFYTGEGENRLGPALAAGETRQLTSECAEGKHALSGGFSNGNSQPGDDLTVRESHPSGFEVIEGDPEGSVKATSWSVTVTNETGKPQHAQVFVTCAAVN